MSDPEVPQYRIPNEGEPIPPVDPEDLKRRWNTRKQRSSCEAVRAAQSQEADRVAVAQRFRMISMLAEGFNRGQLLAPWKHDEEFDDAVFRLAATFPMRPLRQDVYKVAGDEMWGFDPNVFVQRLIEETGISHVWEPVPARVEEGGFCYVTHRVTFKGQGPPDREAEEEALKKFMASDPSDREAKHDARELLWAVYSASPTLPTGAAEQEPSLVAFQHDQVTFRYKDYAHGTSHSHRYSPQPLPSPASAAPIAPPSCQS
jgi:hypothetical protein